MSKSCTIQVNLDMTDHCTTHFCIWRTTCLVPVRCISSIHHMYTTDFAYDGPIFPVPLSPSYPSSPVLGLRSHVQIMVQSLVNADTRGAHSINVLNCCNINMVYSCSLKYGTADLKPLKFQLTRLICCGLSFSFF